MAANQHVRLPKFLNERELARLFECMKNERDLLFVQLMACCGLRRCEVSGLKLEDIDLENNLIRVRAQQSFEERKVPLDDRVRKTLMDCLKKWPLSPENYLIRNHYHPELPLGGSGIHEVMMKAASEAGLSFANSDSLRHSYGVRLASEGETTARICRLMGLRSGSIVFYYKKLSGIYETRNVPKKDITAHAGRFCRGLVQRKFREKTISLDRMSSSNFCECRRSERMLLRKNLAKGIDTLIIGAPGVGKSYLLNEMNSRTMIRTGRLVPLKPAVLHIAEQLYGAGRLKHPVENAESWADVTKGLSRTTVRQWCMMILKSVDKCEWSLVIDDMTDLTKSAAEMLNMLSQKFVMFGAVREIKKTLEPFFWKFERIELDVMTRPEACNLIGHLSGGAVIEDYKLFETYVLLRSSRNPRAICEIIERARKEHVITVRYAAEIEHSGAVRTIDLSPVFMILAALFIAGRFIARGMGNMEVYMFTGIGGAMFMVLRMFASRSRR